ncbi:MAG: riboflavin synthase [Thermoleophilia bacterium]|jgi:riboflavin synthase
MFTGLIEEVGRITRVERRGESAHLSIQAVTVLEGTVPGDSIAVNGACLTVVRLGRDGFVVDAMPETLNHSTLGRATAGTPVNLERSLALGERLGGHLVLGHVDATGVVVSVRPEGIAQRVTISLPEAIRDCVAPKGSIAIDGISLTVIDVTDEIFTVGIIPHTLEATTLRTVEVGRQVNLEADVLARYVVRTLETLAQKDGDFGPGRAAGPQTTLTEQFLRDQGFA